ncbi:MAG: hypothetical protein LBO74_09320 [Candidatus Symbiothrix sp.]|jgi:hypothetical protein|nr:hypothetical protein [Candidatus Symbiothrix sp.]
MAKANIINKEISDNYETYNLFLKTTKISPDSKIKVNEKKKNHPSSLYKTQPLICELYNYVNTNLIIEIRENNSDFSFGIISSLFLNCILVRYDSGGGTHRNNIPDVPLSEQSVTTPHFHKYNKNGYEFAYKTDKLKDEKEATVLSDIEFGFPFFCHEANIKYNENYPELEIYSVNLFSKNIGDDPLENITFAE